MIIPHSKVRRERLDLDRAVVVRPAALVEREVIAEVVVVECYVVVAAPLRAGNDAPHHGEEAQVAVIRVDVVVRGRLGGLQGLAVLNQLHHGIEAHLLDPTVEPR